MTYQLLQGDCLKVLKTLPDASVQCCVTSPPYYGLRDYQTATWEGGDSACDHQYQKGGRNPTTSKVQLSNAGTTYNQYEKVCKKCGALRVDEQIGLEETPEAYVDKLVQIFREVKRVLSMDGVLWLNLGDSYWGGKGQSAQAWSTEHLDRETLQKAQHQITGVGQTRPTDGKHPVIKPKDLLGIPWMVAFALRADGWWLRSDVIWHKPNPMPESVTDRPTKSHEYLFLLSKCKDYYYDYEAILEPASTSLDAAKAKRTKSNGENAVDTKTRGHNTQCGLAYTSKNLQPDGQQPHGMHLKRANGEHDTEYPARNKRSVWTVATQPYEGAHFATFPPKLIEPCILAGSAPGQTVLDPFNGSGTTGAVAIKHHRKYIGIELNPAYIELTKKRFAAIQPVLFTGAA